MELKTWAKTILTVQKYLERVTKAIDGIIYKRAIGSAFVTSKNITQQSCETLSDEILSLSERKIDLINLNTICINALKGIDRKSAKLLILKHMENMQSAEIAKLMDLSDRTYFRRLNTAYTQIEKWLLDNGFTHQYFVDTYKNEGWIMEVYNKNKEIFTNDIKDSLLSLDSDFIRVVINNINRKPIAIG